MYILGSRRGPALRGEQHEAVLGRDDPDVDRVDDDAAQGSLLSGNHTLQYKPGKKRSTVRLLKGFTKLNLISWLKPIFAAAPAQIVYRFGFRLEQFLC